MSITYQARVVWASGTPAPGVQVRLFEPQNGQDLGADLTLQPGLSSADGSFSIQVQDTPLLDGGLLAELSSLSAQFDEIDPQALSLGSETRPILQFTYPVKGHSAQALAFFRKLHRSYRLAHYPPVDFLPSRNGFAFINSFDPFIPTISLPNWLGGKRVPSNYGLCGGMSSAAYDFCLARVSDAHAPDIRQYSAVPNNGTILQRYLLRRSVDTFGTAGSRLSKVGDWTLLPDQGPAGAQKLTLDELPAIRQKLEDGQCVVLGLIYERASDFMELANKIWNNHQVLAYGFSQSGPDTYDIHIYDSNHPNRDDVAIHVQRVPEGVSQGQPVFGLVSSEVIPGEADEEVRGFFPMEYFQVNPPGH